MIILTAEQPPIYGVDYSDLAIFVLGILASVIAFFIHGFINKRTAKKETDREYMILLTWTRDELLFYALKLDEIRSLTNNIIDKIASGDDLNQWLPLFPSFEIAPSFLEQAKVELSRFYRNPFLVKEVSFCHFELCHVRRKLALLESQATDIVKSQQANHHGAFLGLQSNAQSLSNLLENCTQAFLGTVEMLDQAISGKGWASRDVTVWSKNLNSVASYRPFGTNRNNKSPFSVPE